MKWSWLSEDMQLVVMISKVSCETEESGDAETLSRTVQKIGRRRVELRRLFGG